MNTKYSNSQPAFTANLIVKGIKLEADKVKSVGRKMSEYTSHYDNDNLLINRVLVKEQNDSDFYYIDFSNNKTCAGFTTGMEEFKNWFTNASVNDIAKTFARIFKYAKLKEVKYSCMTSLNENLDHTMKSVAMYKMKYEMTKNPIFRTLASNSDRRAKQLEVQIRRSDGYFESLSNKIKEKMSIDSIMHWWEEY